MFRTDSSRPVSAYRRARTSRHLERPGEQLRHLAAVRHVRLVERHLVVDIDAVVGRQGAQCYRRLPPVDAVADDQRKAGPREVLHQRDDGRGHLRCRRDGPSERRVLLLVRHDRVATFLQRET